MWENRRHGAIDIVSGDKPLTVDTAESLRRILAAHVQHGQPRLVMDFRQIPLIDSAGMELLLDTRDACVRRGGAFQLAALNPLCMDIVQLTGAAQYFEIFSDSVAAAGSFAQ